MSKSEEITKDMVVFKSRKYSLGIARRLFNYLIERFTNNIKIQGLENIPIEGSFLVAAEPHQSHADGPLLWKALWPRRNDVWAIAGKVISDSKIRNFYLDSYPGMIYVERRDMIDRKKAAMIAKLAFEEIKNHIKAVPFFVFPGSTRSKKGTLIEAQWRTILPALEANVSIIPTAIIGTNQLFAYSDSLVTLRGMLGIILNPKKYVNKVEEISIIFGKPIMFFNSYPKKENENSNNYAKRCMDIVMCEIGLLFPEKERWRWGVYTDKIEEYIFEKKETEMQKTGVE